jgi:hypothetical protein
MENRFGKKIQLSGHNILKNNFLLIILIFSLGISFSLVTVYAHGVGSEIFPPKELNGKQVSLEVSSSNNDPNQNNDQQISISLIDFNSKITLRDVTFLIKSSRGEQFLFEKEFRSDNGFLVFNFISESTETIQIQEENEGGFFASLLGLESRMINVKGPKLSEGGLYKFDISIITVDDYSKKLVNPLIYNAGISVAQVSNHEINDSNFGAQKIQTITYYDEISNFKYDPKFKEITFSMLFEWNSNNINQTSVIHEELKIPKTFGDLLVSGFSMYVNDIKLSDDVVTIDDFFSDERVVHFIINQKELWNIYNHDPNQHGINFLIKPNSDNIQLSSVTENGQFRIIVSWEPQNLKSNSAATIYFDITDIFLKNRPIAVNYDFSITQNNKKFFEQSGLSTDLKEKHNMIEFTIPRDISGIVYLNFQNLGNNKLAKSSIPIIIDPITNENNIVPIPSWIRNNAGWWADGQIDDETFIQGLEYLIKNDIIVIPKTQQDDSGVKEIPSWIRNNAGWWVDGQIDDETFIQGLEYLLQK